MTPFKLRVFGHPQSLTMMMVRALQNAVNQAAAHAGLPVGVQAVQWTDGRTHGENTFEPVAAPCSAGVLYDPKDGLFEMWYDAGWCDNTHERFPLY